MITAPETLVPNPAFTKLATAEQLEQVAKALEARGMKTLIAADGQAARQLVLDLVPAGAEVYTNQSKTLEKLGLFAEFDQSGRYQPVRPQVTALDRQTQRDQIRKLRASPEYIIGSVQAVTEDGQVVAASFGGSQLGPYASGAAKVIWIIGAQKIVHDLEEAFRRIEEYSYPLEDARLLAALGAHSAIGKLLIVRREIVPGRITIVLVHEELGY
jgi:L-lactate utilization protein LutC